MMKYYKLTVLLLAIMVLAGCKKDSDVNITNFKITKEKIVADALSVRMEGTYEYAGKINSIEVKIGQRADLSDAENYRTIVSDNQFNVTITGLRPIVDYYYCYEIDYGASTTFLTTIKTFTTEDFQLPVVKTSEVDGIQANMANGHGEVTTDGGGDQISVRGLCWSSLHNPTINDFYVYAGTGLGAFDCVMSELQPDQTYYVRAFAGNSKGIAYGNEVSFTTEPLGSLPLVSIDEITPVSASSFAVSATVSEQGASAVIVRGICWNTSPSPVMDSNHESCGEGIGSFSRTIMGLASNTKYYVRAYAVNGHGVAYSDEVTITLESEMTVPTVVTMDVVSILDNMATGGGNVVEGGGAEVTERGICWSTSHNPTLNDEHLSSGSGLGVFSCQMTDLEQDVTYYVRAYAINALGTAYGSEVSFVISSRNH
jgi:hypothetical protein